ncbi:MAG TPA: aminotransferase class I/II-fold pyridoxal phosphate-dependent enzyme, partial [Gammaproteobacteria bacterium]|nr:aminotransferase class I/II-fold pyridoxal phosphate-dependent enzyme [Gammaproteobacteria bacterium]
MKDAYQPECGRMAAVQTPVIPVIADLIAENPGTISLGQGVVYYGPPGAALERLAEINADDNIHRYSHTSGLPALRQLIAGKLKTENHIDIDNGSNLTVTAGSNMAFINALF